MLCCWLYLGFVIVDIYCVILLVLKICLHILSSLSLARWKYLIHFFIHLIYWLDYPSCVSYIFLRDVPRRGGCANSVLIFTIYLNLLMIILSSDVLICYFILYLFQALCFYINSCFWYLTNHLVFLYSKPLLFQSFPLPIILVCSSMIISLCLVQSVSIP